MPQFELDHGAQWFKSLDSFTQGYVEAAFFTIDDGLADKTVADLAMETREAITSECADFQKANEAPLAEAYATDEYEPEQAGRDFWFTRNHHGVGYWDRSAIAHIRITPVEPDAVGVALTKAAHKWPERDLYEGDNGQLYLG